MVNAPKHIPIKLKSLRTEFEELKKEIELIHREIESKHKICNLSGLKKEDNNFYKKVPGIFTAIYLCGWQREGQGITR